MIIKLNRNYTIEIVPADSPIDPRENDNLGTMVCNHRRYTLGDVQNDIEGVMLDLLDEAAGCPKDDADAHRRDCMNLNDIRSKLSKYYIHLPLYLYDHSGITMSTTPFSCRWDSGCVGFIYVARDVIRLEYGWVKLTAKRTEQIHSYLRAEVDEYDHYLRGEAYGYRVYKGKDYDPIDECYGFMTEEAAEQEALSAINVDSKQSIAKAYVN